MCFFFQAEDGIRDIGVTGVQTCALPIYAEGPPQLRRIVGCVGCWSLRRPLMRIVGGLDVHRRQITFDYLDERSCQSRRGRIAPADRLLLRRWLQTNLEGAPAAFAVEACTGWRFVVEELQRAGVEAHLAEPADTAAARGPKRRAKTDRTDARHLRELLEIGRAHV